MAIAATLKEHLDSSGVQYELVPHSRSSSALRSAEAAHVPGDRLAKAVLLGDEDSYLLAVLPASHRLDVERVNSLTGRGLALVHEDEVEAAFSDCDRGAVPAVGEAYGIDVVIDGAMLVGDDVYFEAGDHELLVRMQGDDFRRLMAAAHAARISHHL